MLEVDKEQHLEREAFPEQLTGLLGPYLARQRWYAGEGQPKAAAVVDCGCLARLGDASRSRLLWALVGTQADLYQLVLAERPGALAEERLAGREDARLGSVGDKTLYDATIDPEMALALFEVTSGGAMHAKTARPLVGEQSNSSVVYDEEVILKLFRRLSPGPNRDAEVTAALCRAGFAHVAEPLLRWRNGEADLAFGQRYLAGGTDGWALALTSLRDLYDSGRAEPTAGPLETSAPAEPETEGADFAPEAERLGRVTAEMHVALGQALGKTGDWGANWQRLASSLAGALGHLDADLGPGLSGAASELLGRISSASELGPALHPHGDYHLGQVMRTDAGWYVLDFEGEPNRPVQERMAAVSALKDVAGMLRSFSYAAQFALAQVGPGGAAASLQALADAWEGRNREAFMRGYLAHPGVDDLLPASPEARETLCAAFELDKALYELSYERAYRPNWAEIPMKAVRRLLGGTCTARAGRPA